MNIIQNKFADWANFPSIEGELATPTTHEELQQYVAQHDRLIARGNAKCYGDAALSPHMVSLLAMNKLRSFDPHTGIVDCEAGVLLSDLLPVIIPAGWFFHVTPGIKSITVGGAIASDVHGKNHPVKGCFSNWLISFELMTASGEIKICSRTQNSELFWQTCGGMGWTGIILSAKFELMRIGSTKLVQTSERANQLEGLFEIFESNRFRNYAAAWIDCTAGGSSFGRGAVFFAEHAESEDAQESLSFKTKPTSNVPFFAPSWVLNPLSIRMHNYMYNSRVKRGEHVVELDEYFYPLDRVQNWNRFYGRRGFIQYQFCVPQEYSQKGIRALLQGVRQSKDTPFLSVLKRHGARPAEAVHSFPIEGYSLALDFPRTRTIADLIPKLDGIVWDNGGKVYLTKDALSAPKMGRIDPNSFGEPKFWSLLKGRITGA
ncbi:MAG: FAD-binding oxidoreductase [Bacteroidota bacterium]